MLLLIFYVFVQVIQAICMCDLDSSVPIPDGKLLPNKFLLAPDGTLYPADQHFIHEKVHHACLCAAKPCVRKCCHPENSPNDTCHIGNINNILNFPKNFNASSFYATDESSFSVVYGNPCKQGRGLILPEEDEADIYYVFNNGSLHFPSSNYILTHSSYCFEWDENEKKYLAYLCLPEDVAEPIMQNEEFAMYPVGMIISEPFLLATFLVYALIPELQNLHGKTLMSHVMSLFFAYLFLSILHIHKNIDITGCVISAFVVYFAFFASFFWLNVMCFDIWWTFSGLRPLHGSVKERERKKFIMYSTYAWGSSLVMLIICTLMDRLEGIPGEYYIKPNFGEVRCWFEGKNAEVAYFYGPIGLILVCNILLFILTALKIMKLRKETAMLKEAESKRHEMENNRQQFNLYLKLFIIMGVNWTMELISFAVGGPKELWYITDIGNTLQGVLIFIIFVWKEKVRHLLRRRLCPKLSRNIPKTTSKRGGSPTRSFSSTNITHKTSVVSNGNPETAMRMSTLVHLTEDSDVP